MFDEGRCYRPDEVAKVLGVDKSTVYRLIRDGDDPMPAVKLINCLRIPGKELNEWLQRRRADTGQF